MANNTKREENRAVIGMAGGVRLNYCHLWEPFSDPEKPDEEPMYKCVVMIPKTDTAAVAEIRRAVTFALEEGVKTEFKGVRPAPGTLRNPLRDGDIDRAGKPDFAGMWFINVKSKFQPGIVDRARKPIMDRSEIYSGVFAIVSMNFRAYDKKGNKGIGAQINNIMKVKDGPRLGGGLSAADEFADVVITDEEASALETPGNESWM